MTARRIACNALLVLCIVWLALLPKGTAAQSGAISCIPVMTVDGGRVTFACPTETATSTPVASTATATNTSTLTPSPSPLPTNTAVSSPTDTATPEPTDTPAPATPTDTPEPTNTPVPPTSTPLPTATGVPPTSTPAPQALSVLLRRHDYAWTELQRGIADGPGGPTMYRPRQFVNGLQITDDSWGTFTVSNAGPYAGWDIWKGANRNNWRSPSTNQQWARFTLQRPATVGLVWRGKGSNPPAWLTQQGWTEGAQIATTGASGNQSGSHRVFTKQMPVGEFWVPWVGYQAAADNNTWWVLFGETNGTASPAPFVGGEREVPVPNQTCPQWVHDQYVTLGPDGRAYATWHRVIDPVYWCSFTHEHGDDPALLGVADFHPTFHYAATADGASEFHQGFKVLVWDDGTNNYTHLDVMHFGTSNTNSVCNRFHEMQHAGARNGELLYYYQYQGDFGVASQNNTNDVFYLVSKPTCPQGSGPAPGSTGLRQMPVQSSDINGPSPNPVFYEPWREDERAICSLAGMCIQDFHINNPDPMVICRDRQCADPPITTGKPGAQRFSNLQPGSQIRAPADTPADGYLWTDARATQRVAVGTLGAVRQFVKQGLVLAVREFVNTEELTTDTVWGEEKSRPILGSLHGAVRDPEKTVRSPN